MATYPLLFETNELQITVESLEEKEDKTLNG
jgi:hypothetical protein